MTSDPKGPSAGEISAMLADRIVELAEHLIGSAPTMRTRTTVRFHPRGGLVITTAGKDRGLLCSHGDGGIGGDALDLVKHMRSCSMKEAIAWAADWLGTTPTPARSDVLTPHATPAADNLEVARQIWREALR